MTSQAGLFISARPPPPPNLLPCPTTNCLQSCFISFQTLTTFFVPAKYLWNPPPLHLGVTTLVLSCLPSSCSLPPCLPLLLWVVVHTARCAVFKWELDPFLPLPKTLVWLPNVLKRNSKLFSRDSKAQHDLAPCLFLQPHLLLNADSRG